MQNDVLKFKKEPFSQVTRMAESKRLIDNTVKVVAGARKVGIPVIFIGLVHRRDKADFFTPITDLQLRGLAPPPEERYVEGTQGAEFVPELMPEPDDHVIWKRRYNAFYNTDLELILRRRGVDTIILAGALTDICIATTFRSARDRDFNVIVLSDCCATRKREDDDYFMEKVFPRFGRVRTSKEIITAFTDSKSKK
jgi:nicotinamidase-related amidase